MVLLGLLMWATASGRIHGTEPREPGWRYPGISMGPALRCAGPRGLRPPVSGGTDHHGSVSGSWIWSLPRPASSPPRFRSQGTSLTAWGPSPAHSSQGPRWAWVWHLGTWLKWTASWDAVCIEHKLMVTKGEEGELGLCDLQIQTAMYKTDKVLLCNNSTGNYIQ